MRSRLQPRSGAAVTVGAILASLAVVQGAGSAAHAATTIDITDLAGQVSDNYGTPSGVEGIDKLIDNNPYTKYFVRHNVPQLRFTANADAVVTGYSITSGDDSPNRDPRAWVFEGSTDGMTWRQLDARSAQSFPARFATKTYTFTNTTAYRRFRLRVTANQGSPDTQLGEWRIFGTSAATAPAPSASTKLTATARSADQIELSWNDTSRFETGFRLERSTDGTTFTTIAVLPPGSTRYRDLKLPALSRFVYRVRALGSVDSAPLTAEATTLTATPETEWQEIFHEGDTPNEMMYLHNVGSTVVTYRDAGLAGTDLSFATSYSAAAWQYVQQTYPYLAQQRLFLTLHDGPGSGGTALGIADADTKYRLLVDADGNGWANTYRNRVVLTHEMSHVVEDGAAPVHGSPSFALWQDSKWAEIFQYDVFKGLGNAADAQAWYDDKIQATDDFPAVGTHWFRDWFLPIYRDHGGSATLAKYFDLLSKNFHRMDGDYRRDLNWGEFVHFWSGAAGVNLQPLAATAFGGWPADWDKQFQQAKLDFPGVTYAG